MNDGIGHEGRLETPRGGDPERPSAPCPRGARRQGNSRMMILRRDFINVRIGRIKTLILSFNRGETINWELQALDATFDDGHLVIALLMGLPAKDVRTATVLVVQRNVPVQHAQEQLQAAEARVGCERRAQCPNQGRDTGSALAANGGH